MDGNLEKPIKKMLDITPGKGVKAKALSKKIKVDGVGHKIGFSVTKGSEGYKDKEGSFHYTRKVLKGNHY